MLVAGYNPSQMGDILVVILHQSGQNQAVQEHGNVVRIYDRQTSRPRGFNFLHASHILPRLRKVDGQVRLTVADLKVLNRTLQRAGFHDQLVPDREPKFVVGYVKTCRPHPKSDRLKITQTTIDHGRTVQIVSGSPNMKAGIKVVVAKIGAMMPNGLIIEPSTLKGVTSNGMICAGYELQLPHAPQKPGALILPDSYQVGTKFNFQQAAHLFK